MEAPLQRLARRAVRAEAAVKRKRASRDLDTYLDDKFSNRRGKMALQAARSQIYKQEKARRKEDWAIGTRLLPRRDVGQAREEFGLINSSILYPPVVPQKFRETTWLAEGDRVVVLVGADRGKIGKVDSIDEERQSVVVKDLNKALVKYPDWAAAEDNYTGESIKASYDRSIPWNKVKLVAAVQDEIGKYSDVIVDKLDMRKYFKRNEDTQQVETKYRRIIPGLEAEVPWPAVDPSVPTEADYDTPRMEVEDITYNPRLINAPMPPSILDELRGKYSPLRTRHDPEYIAKKENEEAAKQQRKDGLEQMAMTPFQRAAAEHEAKKGPLPELTKTQLEMIGRAIARERPNKMSRKA